MFLANKKTPKPAIDFFLLSDASGNVKWEAEVKFKFKNLPSGYDPTGKQFPEGQHFHIWSQSGPEQDPFVTVDRSDWILEGELIKDGKALVGDKRK